MSPPVPQRQRVTSPRMGAARSAPARRAVGREIDEQSPVGEVFMRSLVRHQLRLALSVCAGGGVLLGGLPLLFALEPRARDLVVLGLPLPWLVLGVLVYPAFVAAGWWYVRAAERNEREFAELVERS